jgi:hypothetical protein
MGDTGSAAALATIQAWDWEASSFDGFDTWPKWRTLSESVNSLAFEGHVNPARAILRLLAKGALVARAKYQWRAFRAFSHFSRDGEGSIPTFRWRAIHDANPFDIYDLPELGLSKQAAGWDWQNNSFVIATASGDPTARWDTGYAEEHFSAWNIEVYCPPVETGSPERDEFSHVEDNDCEPPQSSASTIRYNRGRPPKYDWEGALAYVTAVANTPDGLETGPGAQAAIERLIADYFTRASNDGNAPCESEIRKRASRVMKAIAALKQPFSEAA